jgi:hypothetical protein
LQKHLQIKSLIIQKVLKTIIKLTILCLLFSGCSKELEPELWGKWLLINKQIDYKIVIEFREDNIYKVYINDSLVKEINFVLIQEGNINEIILKDIYLFCNKEHYSFRGPYILVLTSNCLDRIISSPPATYVKLL